MGRVSGTGPTALTTHLSGPDSDREPLTVLGSLPAGIRWGHQGIN